MAKKVLLVAFNGEKICFAHVLLNALDMHKRGFEVKIIIEGTATQLIKDLDDPQAPFGGLYREVKEKGLIGCVCKACATKMDSRSDAERQNLSVCDDMGGHPALGGYIEQGFEIITF